MLLAWISLKILNDGTITGNYCMAAVDLPNGSPEPTGVRGHFPSLGRGKPPAPHLTDEVIATVNNIGLRVLHERSERLGDTAGGLYGYYRSLLDAKRALQDYEISVANLLLSQMDVRPIVEIGSGWGFMSAALALSGLRVYSAERDTARFAAQLAFVEALQDERPDIRGRLTVVGAAFPDLDATVPRRARLVFTNLVFTTSPEERRRIVEAIGTYSGAIFDAMRFFGQYNHDGGIRESLEVFYAAGQHPRLLMALPSGGGMYYASVADAEYD
jgi:hypothetical protein